MQWFMEGGSTMYAIVLLDVIGFGVLLVSYLVAVGSRFAPKLMWPARIFALLVLFGAALPACVGGVGYWMGLSMMEQAILHAAPEHRAAMRAAGEEIAAIPLTFGGGSAVLLGVIALGALGVAAMPRSSYEDVA